MDITRYTRLLGAWPRRPGDGSRFAVERFTILDGCLVASGWCEGGAPTLLVRGVRVRASSRSFRRRDVEGLLGNGSSPRGFRLCALLPRGARAEHVSLRFGKQSVTPAEASAALEAAPASRTATFDGLLPRFLAAITPEARLLEIGSRARSGNTYRHLFPDSTDYVGLDVTDGPNVDVVGDAHHLRRHVQGPFGFIFSISVFEHLLMPWKVAIEMNHVMETGGLAYVQSHAAWPLHEEPWDFFRFSREAWRGLFNAHTGFELLEAGYRHHANIVPQHAGGGALDGIDLQPAYLLSACLVRKVAEPRVSWDCEVSEVYDLAYSHG